MSTGGPSGWFFQSGWWVEGAGVDPRADVLVSFHEHYHHSLQNSTSFGAVTYLLGRVAELTGDPARLRIADSFTNACRRTQEGFATWASATALSLGLADLAGHPDYAVHFKEMGAFVEHVEGAYLRFHVCQAIARACMQSSAGAVAATKGLGTLRLSDLRNADRPDYRLSLLRRSRFPTAFVAASALEARSAEERAWMRDPHLQDWMFDRSRSSVFESVNRAVYAAVAHELERLECSTLATDGHLGLTEALIADAEGVPGTGIGIESIGGSGDDERMWGVLRTCESEQTRLPGPPLAARMVDPSMGIPSMVAGVDGDAHLFVAFRHVADVRAGYAWEGAPPAGDDVAVWLRRSVLEGERRVVELMNVSALGPGPIETSGIEVHYSVVESALRLETVRDWRPYLKVSSSTLLADLRLADRLRYWTLSGGRFRCCFLSASSFGRGIPVMVGRFEMDDTVAHTIIRPATSSAVGCYRQVFVEVDPNGLSIIEEDGLVRENNRLITFTLAHLIGEEDAFRIRDI